VGVGLGVLVLVSMPAVGCGTRLDPRSPTDDRYGPAAERLIEGELAATIGLGPLDASCTGEDLGPGSVFSCRAEPSITAVGRPDTIEVEAVVSADGQTVDVRTLNVLLADQVEQVEATAAALAAQRTGLAVGPDDLNCADSAVVASVGDTVSCLLTDPADGSVYGADVTIDDLDSLTITVVVGDKIG
jgi:hypothetical protein